MLAGQGMLAGAEGPAYRDIIGCANFLQAPIKYEKSSPTTPVTNFPPPLGARALCGRKTFIAF